jgi:hypothetical protein
VTQVHAARPVTSSSVHTSPGSHAGPPPHVQVLTSRASVHASARAQPPSPAWMQMAIARAPLAFSSAQSLQPVMPRPSQMPLGIGTLHAVRARGVGAARRIEARRIG